ncbi:MAG: GFA family protein [Sulfurifustis sp.]
MSPPYTGRCLCGATRYRVTAEPLTVYACHCTDCQKRSGSAFGLSMWINRTAVEVTQGEAVVHTSLTREGRVRKGRVCGQCGTRLWSEPTNQPGLAVVRPGTLDDTSWLRPVAHIWTRSAQPWFIFPKGVPLYETQPDDYLRVLSALPLR